MDKVYMSFLLTDSTIHFYAEALRGIGNPKRISILLSNDGNTLLITPHDKRDFKSHHVQASTYNGQGKMRVYSQKLCRLIAELHQWEMNKSYRVPGVVIEDKNVVAFDLTEANRI